jgi:hypothetical protein
MLKEMEFTNHHHKKHIMKMNIISSHMKCQMFKMQMKIVKLEI